MSFRPLIWGSQTCTSNEIDGKAMRDWVGGQRAKSSIMASAVKVKMQSGIKPLVGVWRDNTFGSSHVRLAHVVTI
jgi:hypothetical protein